ncbi:MAG: flagellar motor stator protein MotA [Bdellovibrionales bacterium GWB1_55_8]|nr:MAG: flagellar motor stator protein MotA [Bdellovibrionales bacterium GWB1_55_8]
MLVFLGLAVVVLAVFGGFVLEGGKLQVLLQPVELLIIFGAALGSLLISAPIPLIKSIIQQALGSPKDKQQSKAQYTELLLLLYELCKTAKMNPLSLEPHVESPETSEIFKRYPGVLSNHHAVEFICDTLKVQISSSLSPYDLEDLMDTDISAAHEEEHRAPATVARIGDAMPGLGIVAAVLGVVITMGKLTQGKEVIGHSVAAALVGTFLGVLGSYGFMQPLAAKMENNLAEEAQVFHVIKAALLAFAKDAPPKVCVEFARRRVAPGSRPSFEEIDQATSSGGAAARAA